MTVPQSKKYELLNKWFDTNQGRRVAEAFAAELDRVVGYLSGNYLLQIGATGGNDLLANMRFRNKFVVSPSLSIKGAQSYALIENLPFQDSSIDCILAPFSMELRGDTQDFISELDRILKSQGFIIFLGINPCSFWGLAAFLRGISHLSKFSLKLRSVLYLKKLFFTLGYTQSYLSSFYYIPPINDVKLIHNLEFLNEMGKMVWPYPTGFYCFIVQKCEESSQLICYEKEDIDFAFKPN